MAVNCDRRQRTKDSFRSSMVGSNDNNVMTRFRSASVDDPSDRDSAPTLRAGRRAVYQNARTARLAVVV
ncbi:hypothetical protein EVAR_11111_1 [Eumeta japonica]|uniref:Uncharacterized protein n=1 Tax=Eumeta variegata TaxID=151549 RepID=A0A4C1U4A7_EUMVA|nr:hypothetical protein EVAR_11111_1 [Eumeta japonica]